MIPVIVRPVYWQGVLGQLQALPTDAKVVMSSLWYNVDEAFFDVTQGLHKVVTELMPTPSPPPPSPGLPSEPSKQESIPPLANVLKQQPVQPEPLVTPEDFSWLCIRTLIGHESYVMSVAMSADGQTLASGSGDNTVKL